jgi:hypothetical protein
LTTLHQHPQDSQEKNTQDLIEGVLDYTLQYGFMGKIRQDTVVLVFINISTNNS